jgi:hypothetical protein
MLRTACPAKRLSCGINWLGAQVLKLVLAAPFGHAEEEYSVLHASFF